jgi:Predicted pPIWI-associating nuclease
MVKVNDQNNFHEYLNSRTFSQEALKNCASALSDPLKMYPEQSRSVVDQVIQASALGSSTLEHIKLSALPEISRTLSSQSNLTTFAETKLSPIFEQVNAANLSLTKLLSGVDSSDTSKLVQQTALQFNAWKKQFQAADTIVGSPQRCSIEVQSHLTEIAKFSKLSQISLSHLTLERDVGNALKVGLSTQSVLQRTLNDFGKSYSKLIASLSDNPASIISLSPLVSRYSAVEFFNGVKVAESVTVESDEFELEKETHQLEKDIQQETESVLEELLGRLNAELIVPLHGARQSLESINPDRVRHFTTSLRELFTHVLHTLSPDDKVKNWSISAKHCYGGKPTRRARLLYICRSLNHDPFSDFLEKDIDAVLEFLTLFHRGTHEITPTYTDFQLKMMLVRMESALRFLLEIWRQSNVL